AWTCDSQARGWARSRAPSWPAPTSSSRQPSTKAARYCFRWPPPTSRSDQMASTSSILRPASSTRTPEVTGETPSGAQELLRFTVYTLFPTIIEAYLEEALMSRAIRSGLVAVEARDMRRFAGNRTGRVDDTPYGGGAGMVMRVDVAA